MLKVREVSTFHFSEHLGVYNIEETEVGGGESNRESVSCRAVRACARACVRACWRARGLGSQWESDQIQGRPLPFSFLP